jgi:hypothetical protein
VVDGYHELDIEVAFDSGGAEPYLDDLKRHLDIVEEAVSDLAGERMRVACIANSAGVPVPEQSPLLGHLGDDRIIRLGLEPVSAGARI